LYCAFWCKFSKLAISIAFIQCSRKTVSLDFLSVMIIFYVLLMRCARFFVISLTFFVGVFLFCFLFILSVFLFTYFLLSYFDFFTFMSHFVRYPQSVHEAQSRRPPSSVQGIFLTFLLYPSDSLPPPLTRFSLYP
jgi:energy-coupling factor transporter transmembrane protein EcfT